MAEAISQKDLIFVLTRYLSIMTRIVETFGGQRACKNYAYTNWDQGKTRRARVRCIHPRSRRIVGLDDSLVHLLVLRFGDLD